MQIDATIYLNNADTIAIERVPHKGLVRIKIKGADEGSFGDELAIVVWGRRANMPEISDITEEEPPTKIIVVSNEEDVDV